MFSKKYRIFPITLVTRVEKIPMLIYIFHMCISLIYIKKKLWFNSIRNKRIKREESRISNS